MTTKPASSATAADRHPAGRIGRVAFSVVAAIATLLTALLTVGSTIQLFGALSAGEQLAFVAHVPWLGLGWCAAFAVMVLGGTRTARRPAAMQQALAMYACLVIGGMVIARENDPVFYIGFGGVCAVLLLLHPARGAVLRPGPSGVSPTLLVLSLVVAGPLVTYAVRLDELARSVGDGAPFYTGVAATAVSVPLVGLAASLRARGFRLPGWTAAVLLTTLGVASLLFDDPGSLGPVAAALAVVGGVGYAALTERDARLVAAKRDAAGVVGGGTEPVGRRTSVASERA